MLKLVIYAKAEEAVTSDDFYKDWQKNSCDYCSCFQNLGASKYFETGDFST